MTYKLTIDEEKDAMRSILKQFNNTGKNVCVNHPIYVGMGSGYDMYSRITVHESMVSYLYCDGVDYMFETVPLEYFVQNCIQYKRKCKWVF